MRSPTDLFPFPLSASAWRTLAGELAAVWRGKRGTAWVELARVTRSVRLMTVGLENRIEAGARDDAGYETVLAVHRALDLAAEPLRPMNYVDALAAWMTASE